MSDNLLEIKDLSIEFRTYDGVVKAINHMTFSVPKGKTVGLVGETGAGKTTTALAIMGLVPNPPGVVTSGSIVFDGTDLLKIRESEMYGYRGKKIGMIFQNPMTSLNPVYTVGHQISDVIKKHQKVDKNEAWKRAGDMLEIVGIPRERLNNYPHEFSGGMKQRACIAMGLSCNPQLLIADEPTTALDVTIQAQILELMKGLKEKYKTSTIFITHALGVVAEIADYVVVVYAGSVIEKGSIREIFEHPTHPYTQGLFGCLPDIESEESEKLHVIKGSMPDPMDLPKGCKFCPRCDKAMDICREEEPEDILICGEHSVKCHLYRKEGTE
ncbi:ABC transporter ATP-binding protein [Lacrimispora sp. 210928-DFI.3.58]|uniref:ABC transporter ATP-binding protein n=1 Tax=Lacrimispora sp. 210928-DFI.3.58 TaxID=2883214 RepID=UPI0015B7300C|nr:ABC transporter ATP-binding protein [Lacrimispora sp. 210928-DFI.3.58]MCB7320565.1 ABC transporter ATP-binding protein [Lacrimispora sp. 210928-DFI.3.58]